MNYLQLVNVPIDNILYFRASFLYKTIHGNKYICSIEVVVVLQ